MGETTATPVYVTVGKGTKVHIAESEWSSWTRCGLFWGNDNKVVTATEATCGQCLRRRRPC